MDVGGDTIYYGGTYIVNDVDCDRFSPADKSNSCFFNRYFSRFWSCFPAGYRNQEGRGHRFSQRITATFSSAQCSLELGDIAIDLSIFLSDGCCRTC
ncbi:hypothetical protein D3C73_915990 [compost metagenome]